jgi:drug/metabolite transporter (DMT)-like permease
MVYYKKLLSHVNPIVANLFVFLIGAIFLSIVTGATEGFSFSPTGNYVFALLYNAIAASTIGWTLWLYLVKEEDTTVVAASTLIVPLVAFVFGWLLLNETLEPESFVGLALILVGVYLVNQKLSNKKAKRRL